MSAATPIGLAPQGYYVLPEEDDFEIINPTEQEELQPTISFDRAPQPSPESAETCQCGGHLPNALLDEFKKLPLDELTAKLEKITPEQLKELRTLFENLSTFHKEKMVEILNELPQVIHDYFLEFILFTPTPALSALNRV